MPFGKIYRKDFPGMFDSKDRCAKKKAIKKDVMKSTIKYVNNTRELKYYYSDFTSQECSTTGNIQYICNMAQGLTDLTRIGDKIQPVRIQLLMSVYADSSDVTNVVRLIIFQQKGSAYTEGTSVGTNIVNTVYSQPVHDRYPDQFSIIMDRFVTLRYGTVRDNVPVKFSTRRKMRQVRWTGGAVTGALDGQLCFFFMSDSSATPFPKISGRIKVSYYDA